MKQSFPDVRFLWVDVEDDADQVEPLDIENFPSLILARGSTPLFFGTVMPHAQTLMRLIQNAVDGSLPPLTDDPDLLRVMRNLRVGQD